MEFWAASRLPQAPAREGRKPVVCRTHNIWEPLPASRKSRKAAEQGVRCSQFVRLCYNLAPTVSSGLNRLVALSDALAGLETVLKAERQMTTRRPS